MKVLILGSTGMLGQSLKGYFEKQKVTVHGVARTNADFNLNLAHELELLRSIIKENKYDVIINSVALVDLSYCEKNPGIAYLVNTYIVGEIVELCDELNIYFIQISTDHYYSGDADLLHNENAPVVLLNEYAKTKYLAEKLVELYSNTLIVRTNIVGYRNSGNLTFAEWIIYSLNSDQKISGFIDMYTSSIDVDSFSNILYGLILEHATGLINVSAEGVLSKFEFIQLFAKKFNKDYLIEKDNLDQTKLKRGNSLGLSIIKLKSKYPNLEIPTVYKVVDNLFEQYLNNKKEK